eukprot:14408278-Alexandrium_andersonii.AAC.1
METFYDMVEAIRGDRDADPPHPRCASGWICIGIPTCPLVQRIFENGDFGDIYCKRCWDFYCEHFPTLKGTMVTAAALATDATAAFEAPVRSEAASRVELDPRNKGLL